MAEETGRTRFHYGFYAAMEVEYDLADIPLVYEQEVELGKDPVRLDFLVIKKEPDIVLNDPIGEFFRQVNIFEYKSPEDGLSIDDFYKVQAYGLLYKGFGRKVNELPVENITLTIVRHTYPKDMMQMLQDSDIIISNVHSGIYRFEGKLSIEDIINYAEKAIASGNERIKGNAGTVIDVCLAVNKNLGEVREMYEAVREVFKDAFAKEHQDGIQEANERVATDMLKKSLPLQLIEEISKLSEDVIRNLATSKGLAIS